MVAQPVENVLPKQRVWADTKRYIQIKQLCVQSAIRCVRHRIDTTPITGVHMEKVTQQNVANIISGQQHGLDIKTLVMTIRKSSRRSLKQKRNAKNSRLYPV